MRPSKYTPEIAEEICNLIADGVSLRKICQADLMPDRGTVMRWENDNLEFRHQIARAREIRGENDADYLEEINQMVIDKTIGASEAAVISNNKKWSAGKLNKKYNDKLQIGGADDLPAIKTDSTINLNVNLR